MANFVIDSLPSVAVFAREPEVSREPDVRRAAPVVIAGVCAASREARTEDQLPVERVPELGVTELDQTLQRPRPVLAHPSRLVNVDDRTVR